MKKTESSNDQLTSKVYLQIFDAKNCAPNGDPDTGYQRMDYVTNKAEITDVRISRYLRDLMIRAHIAIIYEFSRVIKSVEELAEKKEKKEKKDKAKKEGGKVVEEKKLSGAANRVKQFIIENKLNEDDFKRDPEGMLLKYFEDAGLFGVVFTSKDYPAHITGCVHFDNVTQSINIVDSNNLTDMGITTVLPTDEDKETGSMGRKNFIRYGLFSAFGRFNAHQANINHKTNEDGYDVGVLLSRSLNKFTCSKNGQRHIATIVVDITTVEYKSKNETELSTFESRDSLFKNGYVPFIASGTGDMVNSANWRERSDYTMDFTPFLEKIKSPYVEKVTIYTNDDFIINTFNGVSKVVIKDPEDEFIKYMDKKHSK